jgi:hypothetical protein
MHKLIIKLFAETDTFAPAEFVPIFHRWIQTHALADHLLIDVADYAHVPAGPGTLVVASEANIHMDRGDNRLGLLYVRKLPIAGATNLHETLVGVLGYARAAADLMEKDPALDGRLKFRKDEISLRFNDRLNMPNTPEAFASVQAQVQTVFDQALAGATKIQPVDLLTQKLLTVEIKK